MTTFQISSATREEIMQGPLRQQMLIFSNFMAEGTKIAGEYAQADGLSVEEFVTTQAAMGLHFIAWTMLSGASATGKTFDAAEFGAAAERLARDVAALYARCHNAPAGAQ